MFQMMGVFAEFEHAIIKERVLSGLARAREDGVKLGRRRLVDKKVAAIRTALSKGTGVRRAALSSASGMGPNCASARAWSARRSLLWIVAVLGCAVSHVAGLSVEHDPGCAFLVQRDDLERAAASEVAPRTSAAATMTAAPMIVSFTVFSPLCPGSPARPRVRLKDRSLSDDRVMHAHQ
jgi:Resolvase, N terminal domain